MVPADPRCDQIRDLLGVGDCVHVSTETSNAEGVRTTTYRLAWRGEEPPSCPVCGGKLYRHGKRSAKVAHTPTLGRRTWLSIEFPRLRCSDCGNVWQPKIPGVDERRKMTDAAYVDIAQGALRTTFREVAERYPVSHVTVKNVFVDFMSEHADRLRFRVPELLGIDEKHFARFGMVTVITDLEHKTVFDLVQGRKQADLEEYFAGVEGLDRVMWVCSDMYRPFWKSLAKYTPNATWVIDHFHVVKGANEALDAVRKSLQSKLDKKGRLELKKGLAYTLRKRSRDLKPSEASALRDLRADASYGVLMAAYDLKEDFFDIYDANPTSRDAAEAAFDAWKASVPEASEFEPFRALGRTVDNHREFIFNWWDCPARISNGYTECANRLIAEADMKGRGYDFEVLRARTLYRKQNLERIMASGGLSIGPRIDSKGPLFHIEPDCDGADEFIDPLSGEKIDADTGEVLE